MQTQFDDQVRRTALGARAEEIIQKCVHCGFCNVTCPTYNVLGDELDGPRGRIYLIKNAFETQEPGPVLQRHLDRCLGCRTCETTCPAGVRYGELLDIGREVSENVLPRSAGDRLRRRLWRGVLTRPAVFRTLLGTGRLLRPVLPLRLRSLLPPRRKPGPIPSASHKRRVVMLRGCVQSAIDPVTNAAAVRVLSRLGIGVTLIRPMGCCGAIDHHLGASEPARARMRANMQAVLPLLDEGAEAVLAAASGCNMMLKDYARVFADDPEWAEKAARFSGAVRDLSELVTVDNAAAIRRPSLTQRRVAVHDPCSLVHGQGGGGRVEALLRTLGFEVAPAQGATQCCGAAGTYQLLQPEVSDALLERKLGELEQGGPELIVTANVGCQAQLQRQSKVPVRHWIELLDARVDF